MSGISLRGGRQQPPKKPRAPKLMPRSKRYLIGQLFAVIDYAAELSGGISDEPSNIAIWPAEAKHTTSPPDDDVIGALRVLCDHVLRIEQEAELLPRERMRPKRLLDYNELRTELIRVTYCATSVLRQLTKKRCTWAAIDPDLNLLNRLTARLALLLTAWTEEA